MDKLVDALMHPVSQLIFLAGAFFMLGAILFNLPDGVKLPSVAMVSPATDTPMVFGPPPTISPIPTELPTITAVPSATPWPDVPTVIPTSTPWPTDTPIVLPTVMPPVLATVQPTAIPLSTNTPILPSTNLAPPFTEICDTNDTLTDLQQEALAAALAQKRVVGWVGRVYDVERDGSAYKILVDMRQGPMLSHQVEILDVSREIAAMLHVNQQIRIDGTIQSVQMLWGEICYPIYIRNASISF